MKQILQELIDKYEDNICAILDSPQFNVDPMIHRASVNTLRIVIEDLQKVINNTQS